MQITKERYDHIYNESGALSEHSEMFFRHEQVHVEFLALSDDDNDRTVIIAMINQLPDCNDCGTLLYDSSYDRAKIVSTEYHELTNVDELRSFQIHLITKYSNFIDV